MDFFYAFFIVFGIFGIYNLYKMKTHYKLTFLLFLISISLYSQSYKSRLSAINVEHYKLALEVNDDNDNINGLMTVSMRFKKKITTFDLDLVEQDSLTGKGMKVESVFQNDIGRFFTTKQHTNHNS